MHITKQDVLDLAKENDIHQPEKIISEVASALLAFRITNVYIEEAYRGNYHLYATINGTPQRFIIRKKTAEHELINQRGISHVDIDILQKIVITLLHH